MQLIDYQVSEFEWTLVEIFSYIEVRRYKREDADGSWLLDVDFKTKDLTVFWKKDCGDLEYTHKIIACSKPFGGDLEAIASRPQLIQDKAKQLMKQIQELL